MLIALMLGGCMTDSNTVFDEFHEVNIKKWSWHEPQTFVFDVKEEGYVYDMVCGLRISGSYAYSNIWLLYTVPKSLVIKINLASGMLKLRMLYSSNVVPFTVIKGLGTSIPTLANLLPSPAMGMTTLIICRSELASYF